MLHEATQLLASNRSTADVAALVDSSLESLQSSLVSSGAVYDLYLLGISVLLILLSVGLEVKNRNILQVQDRKIEEIKVPIDYPSLYSSGRALRY